MVRGVVQPLALHEWIRRRELRRSSAFDDFAWPACARADRVRTQAQWAAKTLKFGRIDSGDPCVAVSVGSEREFPPPT
jgi:hypothetical protein